MQINLDSVNELKQQESFLQNIAMRKIIPPKVMQKLRFLQLSLSGQSPDRSQFDLINHDELQSLEELPRQSKRSLFLNIINTFNQPTILYGQAYVLGKTGFFWDLRKIELDIKDNRLTILRKNKQLQLDLRDFELQKEDRQDKCSLTIKEQDCIQKRAKFTLGFDSKEEYLYWYKNIRPCCRLNNDISNSIISLPRKSNTRLLTSMDENNLSKSTIDFTSEQSISPIKYPEIKSQEDQIIRETLQFPPLFEDLKFKASLDFLKSDINFQSVLLNDQISISQNTENSNHFKVIVGLPKLPIDTILLYLLDPQMVIQWNQDIEFTKLNLILNEDLTVIEEKHKSFGSLYRSRHFHLMRYLKKVNDREIYIYEKSTDPQDASSLWSETSGRVQWAIYGIYLTPEQKYTMILQMETINGGALTKSQELSMTLLRLSQFQNLRAFLKTYKKVNQIQLEIIPKSQPKKRQEYECTQEEKKSILKKKQDSDDSYDLYYIEPTINYQERVYATKCDLRKLLKEVEQNTHWFQAIHAYKQGILKEFNEEKFVKTEEGYHFFYSKEWTVDEKKGVLKFVDQFKLDQQKRVFKFLVIQIGSNLVQGKSILNISLPIFIFEKRSNLERYAQSYNYAPYYLERAAKLKDPVEQMKLVVAFGITTIISYLTLEKPFNPILGETYQGYIKGCPIYLEQISHHPPILSLLMIGRGYRIYCSEEAYASMGANSVVGGNIGCINIEFLETKNIIKYHICQGVLGGITLGDRIFYLEGKSWFIDQKNKILADMQMNPSSGFFSKQKYPLDQVLGGIYKIDDAEIERYNQLGYKKYSGLNNHSYQKLMDINGRFHKFLKIGEDEVFNIMKDYPFYLINHPSPLASDCKYREDVIAWKLNDEQLGTEKKEKLEIIQRNDRKLRARLGPKKH